MSLSLHRSSLAFAAAALAAPLSAQLEAPGAPRGLDGDLQTIVPTEAMPWVDVTHRFPGWVS